MAPSIDTAETDLWFDVEAEERATTIRRMRSLLRLKTGSTTNDKNDKDKQIKEAERWKKFFKECDSNGSGTLFFSDVLRMARVHLKIAERTVSDEQLEQFFNAVDSDMNGEINFSEFLDFIRMNDGKQGPDEDKVMSQLKRVIKLALRRLQLSIGQVQSSLNESVVRGIACVTAAGEVALRPEGMIRFFRKVIDVQASEVSDKNLSIAFRLLDEDSTGLLSADCFLAFVREAIQEESPLSPQMASQESYQPGLIGGMRDFLPDRASPTFNGSSHFRLSGRDSQSTSRIAQQVPSVLRPNSVKQSSRSMLLSSQSTTSLGSSVGSPNMGRRPTTSSLGPGSPTSGRRPTTGGLSVAAFASKSWGSLPPASPGSGERRMSMMGAASPGSPGQRGSLKGAGAAAIRPTTPAGNEGLKAAASVAVEVGDASPKAEEVPAGERGSYMKVKGILKGKDAQVLNRLERRLCGAGIDVRGLYHRVS